MSRSPHVRLERRGPLAVLSYDRPEKHNAFTDEMDAALFGYIAELSEDRDVRCLVWRGEGPSFCSGRDTSELGQRPGGISDLDYIARGHRATRLLMSLPFPTLVALKGWVIGGAFERALLCDLRIAATDTRMRLPELDHGVIPDSGGVARLVQTCGPALTADLVLTGRVLSAEEALRYGIVSRLVAPEELDEVVFGIAERIAGLSPVAVRMAVTVLRELVNPPVDATLTREMVAQALVMAGEEFRQRRRDR